jgi:hypothetical protein
MVIRYMQLQRFAGALNMRLAPVLHSYGNLPAMAIRRRKNTQLTGLPATLISQRDALISRPMAA